MIDQTEADADIAVRYLKALLARGVPNTDALTMTSSYMTTRAIVAGSPKPLAAAKHGELQS